MSLLRRLTGLIVLMGMIVAVAILILIGYTTNTIFYSQLPMAGLPADAVAAFNGVVSGQLTAWDFIVVLPIILAIVGGIAAIFGLSSPDELNDY